MPRRKKAFSGKKKTRAEQIAAIPTEEIMKMTNDDLGTLRKYVSILRQGYNRRISQFKRKGAVSYAQIQFENSIPDKKPVQLTKLTRNQLILEFSRLSNFFNSKTSTLQGIKEVNKEQDVRLFGSDDKGKPLRTMTDDERKKYWSLYMEYNNQHPIGNQKYSSETIQQVLADMVSQSDAGQAQIPDPDIDLVSFLDAVETKLATEKIQKDLQEAMPNVYMGRGFNFHF